MEYYKQQIKSLLKNISKKVSNEYSIKYISMINYIDNLDDITICELYSTLSELNKNNNYELLEKYSKKLSEYT
jgi:hypothetical protein